jgi:hypothetical protein
MLFVLERVAREGSTLFLFTALNMTQPSASCCSHSKDTHYSSKFQMFLRF